MKMGKRMQNVYGLSGLLQFVFIVLAVYYHDFLYLGVAFVLNPNMYRIVNYEGSENDL